MNNGKFSPDFNLSRNSVASSIIVKSAPKFVSNTKLKPIFLNAAFILPMELTPGSSPNISPIATRVAGAI